MSTIVERRRVGCKRYLFRWHVAVGASVRASIMGCGVEENDIHASGDPSVDPARIILKPKLRAPVPRPEQLVRRGLLGLLHDALDCKVSVISAPTGYGKTTLLAQWRQAEEAEVPFAWVSLDEQDNDPIRLWRHIVEALRRVVPEERIRGRRLVGIGRRGRDVRRDNALPAHKRARRDAPAGCTGAR